MISVRCEWTLKWSLSPPPPSFLRALIKWGSCPSISPMASSPTLVCGPLCLLATAIQIYLFPGMEKGEKTGRGGTRVAPRGSCCLPLWHLQPGGAPGGHHSECPATPSVSPDPGHPDPHFKFGDSKLVFTLSPPVPLALSQIFKALFRLFLPLFLLKNKIYI